METVLLTGASRGIGRSYVTASILDVAGRRWLPSGRSIRPSVAALIAKP